MKLAKISALVAVIAAMGASAFAQKPNVPSTLKPTPAATSVHSYTRKTKAGKVVTVHGYNRKVKAPKTVAVKGYDRTTKSGKTIHVKGYTRKVAAPKKAGAPKM